VSTHGDQPPKVPGREPPRLLPKRFYTSVTVTAAGHGQGDAGFCVLLDDNHAHTPKRRELLLPTLALANAVAAEWDAQRPHVDPSAMPLTRLVNTAIDGVQQRAADVRADIVKYADSDLLCYRAEAPEALVALQAAAWDPILAWAHTSLGMRLALSRGVIPVRQSRETLDAAASAVARLDAFRLAALHVMVTLTGSAVLGLAVLHGHLAAEAAWAAAHVDEDWQIAQWGEDAEAGERRQRRWADMRAAADVLGHLA
jgi:chaperone required for assembly of F1-ATPase